MSNTLDEMALLNLAATVLSAVEEKAHHYRYDLGHEFEPVLSKAAAERERLERERRRVRDRAAFLPELTRQLETIAQLIADKPAARANAAEAERAIRRFSRQSGNLLLMNGPTARGLACVDGKLKIAQIRTGIRSGASAPDQLEDDVDHIGRLAASARLAQMDLTSSVLQGAIAVLGVAEADIRRGDESLNEITRAIHAVATVDRIVGQAVAIVG